MTALRVVIAELYRELSAPDWAAPNLDGLADVLRDLSWLPPGPVRLAVPTHPGLAATDRERLLDTLRRAEAQTAGSPRPVRVGPAPGER